MSEERLYTTHPSRDALEQVNLGWINQCKITRLEKDKGPSEYTVFLTFKDQPPGYKVSQKGGHELGEVRMRYDFRLGTYERARIMSILSKEIYEDLEYHADNEAGPGEVSAFKFYNVERV